MRSAMAPDTMVAAVAANTTWKNHSRLRLLSPRKKSPSATKPPIEVPPYASPNPTAQLTRDPTAKSMKFFMMMLPALFARVNPASTRAKPGCMNITRIAATMIHSASTAAATSPRVVS